jgi:hypothetical protein
MFTSCNSIGYDCRSLISRLQIQVLKSPFSEDNRFSFIPDQSNMLPPARLIDWDAFGKHMEADIIQTLTMDRSFINSGNEQDQCFHACRLLRMDCMPAVPYSMIGRILGIDKGLVR